MSYTTMQSEHSLHSANEMLKKSSQISSIVTALAKVEKECALDREDERALEEGLAFLEEVEKGYNWMEEATPSVNRESRLRAKSLNTAVDSWGLEESTGHFLEDVEHMKRTLEKTLQDNNEDLNLSQTIKFFINILNSNLDSLDSMYPNSILDREEDQWTYAIN